MFVTKGAVLYVRRIGIFGGTFDPPHIGHMIIAKEVQQTCRFDEVWFIPTNDPPHKKQVNATAKDRYAMVQEMIQAEPTWKVLDIEIKREGPSFTIDTIIDLQKMYPSNHFYFIIGADMVEYLPKWHKIDELIQRISFICVNRPNHTLESPYPITEVRVPLIDISSTMIRDRLMAGRSPHYFLEKHVHEYLKEHQLYGYRSDQA